MCYLMVQVFIKVSTPMFHCRNLLWLIISCLVSLPAWAKAYEHQQVVYHVNYGEISRINATFGNINNHIEP